MTTKPTAQPPKETLLVRRLGTSGMKALVASTIGVAVARQGPPALPAERWPSWATDIAKSRQAGDTGIGDTVVTLIGIEASEGFKAWFQEKFGTNCGCTERQRWLNARFPYL